MSPLAVGVVTIMCFMIGAIWYSPLLFGDVYAALRGLDSSATSTAPPLSALAIELFRCLVVTCTFAYFVARLGIDDVNGALTLGFLVWLGFQGFVLLGSVIHEGYPVQLFAIHAGDALVKALASCVILAVWRRRALARER
jgi:hypothetical protein